jgi:adenylate cyclase
MKNLLKVTAAAFLLTSSVAFANTEGENKNKETTEFKMSMYFDSSSEKIKTFFEKAKGDYLQVSVLDENNRVLSKITFGKKELTPRLNLDISGLKDGNYTLVVTNGNETTERDLKIDTTTPERVLEF